MANLFDFDKIRRDLAIASTADAARRVKCPVCNFNTANIERHEILHAE